MALVIIFNPDSTPVANRVTRVIPSANTLEYLNRVDALVNPVIAPELDPLAGKVENGAVVPLSQQDLDDIAAAQSAASAQQALDYDAAIRAEAKLLVQNRMDTFGVLLRSLALTILDEINTLRAQHSLAPRTATQLRNAIQARVDAKTADNI